MNRHNFRAYNKITGDFIRDKDGGFKVFTPDMFLLDNTCAESPEDIEWMQSTGLLDVGGVEIYEGDIVKRRKGRVHVSENLVKTTPGWEYREVKWVESSGTRTGFNIAKGGVNPWKVIGNVYENPDMGFSNV
jgi:uncharacterized phage protein (TIGR01671 family)